MQTIRNGITFKLHAGRYFGVVDGQMIDLSPDQLDEQYPLEPHAFAGVRLGMGAIALPVRVFCRGQDAPFAGTVIGMQQSGLMDIMYIQLGPNGPSFKYDVLPLVSTDDITSGELDAMAERKQTGEAMFAALVAVPTLDTIVTEPAPEPFPTPLHGVGGPDPRNFQPRTKLPQAVTTFVEEAGLDTIEGLYVEEFPDRVLITDEKMNTPVLRIDVNLGDPIADGIDMFVWVATGWHQVNVNAVRDQKSLEIMVKRAHSLLAERGYSV